VGDLKNFPYGTKKEEEVKDFAKRITTFLLKQHAKLIIVACNTVSSIAIDDLKKLAQPVNVIGMVQAGAKYAVDTTKNKRVGVISTPLTAKNMLTRLQLKNLIETYRYLRLELKNL